MAVILVDYGTEMTRMSISTDEHVFDSISARRIRQPRFL